jgi:hypothetical protein
MIDKALHGVPHPVHEVDHAFGETCHLKQLHDPVHHERDLLAGFQHDRAPAHQRDREHPVRDHEEEVERHGAGDNAKGIPPVTAQDVGAHEVNATWYGITAGDSERQQRQLLTAAAGTVNGRLQLTERPYWQGGGDNVMSSAGEL